MRPGLLKNYTIYVRSIFVASSIKIGKNTPPPSTGNENRGAKKTLHQQCMYTHIFLFFTIFFDHLNMHLPIPFEQPRGWPVVALRENEKKNIPTNGNLCRVAARKTIIALLLPGSLIESRS
jgi:hypothetical protein